MCDLAFDWTVQSLWAPRLPNFLALRYNTEKSPKSNDQNAISGNEYWRISLELKAQSQSKA